MDEMQTYYGTKKILAISMSLGEYHGYQGWDIPEDKDPNEPGFLVEYTDGGLPNHRQHKGYISWSPYAVFMQAYQPTRAMSFGHALQVLQEGKKVSRQGWNGKGMFLYYVPENKYPATRNEHAIMQGVFENDLVPYRAYIAMKTAQDDVVPWVASQTDMLANDWQIVED